MSSFWTVAAATGVGFEVAAGAAFGLRSGFECPRGRSMAATDYLRAGLVTG